MRRHPRKTLVLRGFRVNSRRYGFKFVYLFRSEMRRVACLLSALVITPVITLAGSADAAITKGPWIQRVTPTTALVRFEVDPPAPAMVKLGADAPMRDGGAGKFESPEATTLHSVAITGLMPSTRYAYEVSTAGATKLAAVTTAPKDDSTASFRFLVYGDNRTDDAAHAAVVRGMTATQADFLVHTGDFVENGASKAQWQTFFDIEAPLLHEKPLFSCVGNHELIDGTGIEYVRYFGPTETVGAITAPDASAKQLLAPDHINSTFRWANTRFFMLNGMVAWRSGADRKWLDKALSDSDGESNIVWRIVVVHYGPWSSGPHGNNRLLHDAGIPAMLRSHKVDLVISGHDHIYERGFAEGLAYMVSGGGGAPTYRIKSALPSAKKFESVRHFVEASVSQAAISFGVLRPDGSVIERCALRKEGGWDCDAPAKTETTSASSSTTTSKSSGESSSPPPSRCSCRVAGERTRAADGGALCASFVALAAIYCRRRRRAILDRCDSSSRCR
jgi:acid phosphatase type 7